MMVHDYTTEDFNEAIGELGIQATEFILSFDISITLLDAPVHNLVILVLVD
jgi:hypothetical protein